MQYFLDTVQTIPDGLGFSQFDRIHLSWLAVFIGLVVLFSLLAGKWNDKQVRAWQITMAILIVLDEIFKDVMLCIGNRFTPSYLPFHLCSINIFIILIHAFKPSKLLDNFLYMVCIPGAIAAMLFPTWTELPVLNFMHLHSTTVHIMLAMYPLVLAITGRLNIDIRMIPKCLLMLLLMAIPIYGINWLLDTNFMFLMEAEAGNPLYWFGQNWGNHLLGFPVLIAAVLFIMYVPRQMIRRLRKK